MMAFINIEKLDKATAGFVVNLKNPMINDTAIPPPPTPATTHKAITNEKTARPIISNTSGGQTALCPQ